MRPGFLLPGIGLAFLLACGGPATSVSTDRDETLATSSRTVPLFSGMGTHSRPITTSSPLAQRYFDQGLAFLYAFNHDEAIRSFRRAAEIDPNAAMAWWGIAYANGPHINFPMVPPERATEAWAALGKAKEAATRASPIEKALIQALFLRHADPQPQDRTPLDQDFAFAMRQVWAAYPNDPDVGALFAEAMMDLRPWDLWTEDGHPQPGTPEILEALEAVIALDPKHPLANHLYIHAVEASPEPGKADRAADALRDLQPALGHLVHMPSHIDVRRGRWVQAIEANTKAIEADRLYLESSPHQGFYRVYMFHNHHMKAYAAMMTGQSAIAIETIKEMIASVPEDWLHQNASLVDGYLAMPLEVLMRFGRWDDILAAPDFKEHFPLARALRHYARGVALAARGRVDDAANEEKAFLEARKKVAFEATFGNNKASDILDVAQFLLQGEILYRVGQEDEGFEALREAVRREDRLAYNEPPDWIQPIRHALGAALTSSARLDEAEDVFREDLLRLPNNGWSLFGLSRVLAEKGQHAEAVPVRKQFDDAWKEADVSLDAACYCQAGG
jgi:tetratricopeptide (TPR) repeat protein